MAGIGRTDIAAREIAATPATVFAALTDPAAIVQWLPPDGMTGRMHTFDLREGGGYRMELVYADPMSANAKSTANSDIVAARFGSIDTDSRIVQYVDFESDDPAFAGTMTMIWSLAPSTAGTIVTITCQNVPEGISKPDHDTGLASSLENLARYTE